MASYDKCVVVKDAPECEEAELKGFLPSDVSSHFLSTIKTDKDVIIIFDTDTVVAKCVQCFRKHDFKDFKLKVSRASMVHESIINQHLAISDENMSKLLDSLSALTPKQKEQVTSHLSGASKKTSVAKKLEDSFKTPLANPLDCVSKKSETIHVSHSEMLKLPNFSGKTANKNSDSTSFQQWLAEVSAIRDGTFSDNLVRQAIRRSLRGSAADVLLHGENLSIDSIIDKLKSRFGEVLPVESVLETFYSARQNVNETCADWASRLENLLGQLRRSDSCPIPKHALPQLLKSRLFSGLHSSDIRHYLRSDVNDTCISFEDFLMNARRAEVEFCKKPEVQVTSQSLESDNFDKMFKLIGKLTDRVGRLEKEPKGGNAERSFQSNSTNSNDVQQAFFPGTCHKCKSYGHKAAHCLALNANRSLMGGRQTGSFAPRY